MENLGKITLFGLMMIGSFLTSLFSTKIIMSIASLYQLAFITQFTFVQILGIILITNIVKYKHKKVESGREFSDIMKDSFTELFTTNLLLLIGWGFAFVYYYVLS